MQNSTQSNAIRTNFSVSAEWDQGFTGKLDILNSEELLQDWTIEFESEFEIEPDMIWGAKIVERQGDRYTLAVDGNNETIKSQGTAEVFFNANKINGQIINPTNFVLNDSDLAMDASIAEAPEPLADVIVPEATLKNVSTEDIAPEDIAPEDIAPAIISIPGSVTEADLAADVDFTLVNNWDSGFEGKISITNNTGGNIDTWDLQFDFPNQITNIWDAEIELNENGSYVIENTRWNREIAAGETLTFGFTGENSVTSEPQNFELDGTVFTNPSISSSIYTYENPDLQPQLELNGSYQGRATFYDAANPVGGKGASGFDVPVQSELEKVVAINNIQWNGSDASGAFFQVSGPKQREGAAPITVQVVDYLVERADGFDMSAEAFAEVADPIDGVVNIDYQLVGPGDDYITAYGYSIGQGIVVEGIAGTNPYYAAVRLNNHRYPIESVDLLTESGESVELSRESDNRFVLDGEYPLNGAQDLLVTDIFGQQVTLDDVNITNGSEADIVTGEQFSML